MKTEKNIIVSNLSKSYRMYARQSDRIKEVFQLNKKPLYTDFFALSNVSFDVKKGNIMGIIGKNGSGKSTLLKILTGILAPTFGTYEVKGRVSSLLELGTGFNMEYSGIENIYFYGMLMGISRVQMDERINEIIEFAEIGDHIYQPVKTYSSGMFSRLAFSCAINIDPDILIVDEILSVGDMRFQAKSFNRFREFKERGTTIIYVGHDIYTMRTFCDVCMWLNDGKVVEIGDPTYVSSLYSEFMYRDDDEPLSSDNPLKTVPQITVEDKTEVLVSHADFASKKKPMAHWGSQCGMIKNIRVEDGKGNDVDIISPHDVMRIIFDIDKPLGFNSKYLSAAFSIKDTKGVDLIVQTTYGLDMKFEDMDCWHVEFSFHIPLNIGDYYLVLALENREHNIVSYYEYIEGAKYFKVFSADDYIYGQFLLGDDVKVNISH